jgi:hypothetical protein
VDGRGAVASGEITASDGSRTKVNVLGAPSSAEAMMAAAKRYCLQERTY